MSKRFVTFQKFQNDRPELLWIEVIVAVKTKAEARTIAERELRDLNGYRFQGIC
jgi:hypothetical protein